MQFTGLLCETGEPATITISASGSQIEAVHSGISPDAIGGQDVYISPGFFDLQLNGYGGHDFNSGIWEVDDQSADSLAQIFEMAAAAGTALLLPTIVTNSSDAMCASLNAVRKLLEKNPRYAAMAPGIHVEGPYFSSEDGPRGAHPLQYIRDPDYAEFQQMQVAAGGRIKLFTLAPERDGALPFIEKLTADGVVVSIGHTGATPQRIREAISAGVRLSTHLGNGAHAMLPRHPNYIWEQMAADELYATLITDGHHLPPAVAKSMVRAKGYERCALVSDAVALGGLPPGDYSNGIHEVLPGGKIVLCGTPYLAGAGHLLDVCVANAARFTDMSIKQAALAASQRPAEILGLSHRKGSITPGFDADLTLFRFPDIGPLEIVATVSAGNLIYVI